MKLHWATVGILFIGVIGISNAKAENTELVDENDQKECRDYHSLKNKSDICKFINSTDDCAMDGGFVNYLDFALCKVKPKTLPGVYALYTFWLLFLFIALGTTAESFFCPALEFIAFNLKLSHNIAGITVVAFGNGAPDIFSAVAAFTNSSPGSSGVAVGALLGAGVFVTTVVAGAVSVSRPFKLAERPFLRDVVFYLATVFWTFCLLYQGEITLYNSIGYLLLYVVYVIVVLLGRYIHQKMRKKKKDPSSTEVNFNENCQSPVNDPCPELQQTDENGDWIDQPLRADVEHEIHHCDEEEDERSEVNEDGDDVSADYDFEDGNQKMFISLFLLWRLIRPINWRKWRRSNLIVKIIEIFQSPIKLLCNLTVPVVNAESDGKKWSRTLSCIHCISTPLFCCFGAKGGGVKIGGVFPLWGLLLILGTIAAVAVWFTSQDMKRPKYYWVFAYVGFISSIIWTYSIANEIVNLLRTFGALLDVSNVIMGLTLLAWGNSIGDMVADVTLARQGYPRMAISACFGGPFFNLIIGIGLPCTIAALTNGHGVKVSFDSVEAVLAGSLLFSLVFSFIVLPVRSFQANKLYGAILIVIYVIYLPIVILAGIGVI